MEELIGINNKELINKGLREIIEGTISAKDFILAESSEVCKQIIIYELSSTILGLLFSVLALIVSVFVFMQFFKEREGYYQITQLLVASALFAIGSISLLANLIVLLKIWLTPKLFLIEYVKDLF